jgi:putative peptidoglycan lipid II flippase
VGGSQTVVGNTLAGSVWTVVSRLAGLAKIVAVGAVLGATYLANTYQAINSIPNLVYYQLLAGSLFASLLVPPLMQYTDAGDRRGAQRLVQGFLGALIGMALLASAALLALGPLIVRLFSLGVSDPQTAGAQAHIGWLFLLMFVPQILLYVVAGTGAAAMNAYGRFALAAGAPALESLGMVAVLAIAAAAYGTAITVTNVSTSELILLGLGTTAAVALHAGLQWWGAKRSKVTLVPGPGWKDPEVRQVIRRIVPTLAYTGMAVTQIFAVLVVANRLAGGLVAFQLALNFFYLPTAVLTWPLARALLPQLARLHNTGDNRGFRDELIRGVRMASFVTVPIALGYMALAFPLARAIALGQLQNGGGPHLMAVSLTMLGPAVIGETWFILGTYDFYARQDARSPLLSMAVRVGTTIALMSVAWLMRGTAVLIMLGLALSVGSLAGGLHVGWRLRTGLPRGEFLFARAVAKTVAASALMALPAYVIGRLVSGLGTARITQFGALAGAALVGLVTYGVIQTLWRAPELAWLKSGVGHLRRPPGEGRS